MPSWHAWAWHACAWHAPGWDWKTAGSVRGDDDGSAFALLQLHLGGGGPAGLDRELLHAPEVALAGDDEVIALADQQLRRGLVAGGDQLVGAVGARLLAHDLPADRV